jgi:hypothetical protein
MGNVEFGNLSIHNGSEGVLDWEAIFSVFCPKS